MAGQCLRLLFWITMYGVFCMVVSATEEELLDFDFSDLKEIDWNYNDDNNQNSYDTKNRDSTTSQENLITFDDDLDLEEDNQVHPFDWREKMLRTALSKALTNKAVRQKFIEVMPILRVLSKQQRLALSSLITAQISAKKGHELKLEQVRMMFGDDKSLLLPIVYDIANLVRNSAKKYIEFDYSIADLVNFPKTKVSYERRTLDLKPEEAADEESNQGVGTIPVNAKMSQEEELEDFMADEADIPSGGYLDPREINAELGVMRSQNATIPVTVTSEDDEEADDNDFESAKHNNDKRPPADPLRINHELQKDVPTMQLLKAKVSEHTSSKSSAAIIIGSTTTPSAPLRRTRRSLENLEFVHKLVRSVPATLIEPDMHRGLGGRTLKLNTTAFATPKETTLLPQPTPAAKEENIHSQDDNSDGYQLVENFAFASLNGSEITLTEAEELAKESESESELADDDGEQAKEEDNKDETLPTPEELIAGPRYRISGTKVIAKRITAAGTSKRKRIAGAPPPPPPKRPIGSGVPPPTKCERFTASMCIRTEDYPMDLIMGSIRRHRNAMTALLAEHTDPTNAGENPDDFEEYVLSKKRRQDTNMVLGGLCQSIVRYARPQKARSASGEWKYIVNTGQHTQTLRLEKCTNPQESCSYLSANYRSHCAQVYNYHRLLSWDKTRGLHVDIFKVPTCCSCQVDGYKQQQYAAALSSAFTKKDYSSPLRGDNFHHSDADYTDEDDDENDFGFSIRSHHRYKPDAAFDGNELYLSSNRVKTKLPSPTVGSYLSPPGSDEFDQYPFKLPKDSTPILKPSSSSSSSSTSSSSSSSSKTFLRDLARRRPHKSYNDYHTDLDFAPSEQHAEREAVGTTALRPSPLAPEPFVPSQQDDLTQVPMPTKSHQKPQLSYQPRAPLMEQQQHYPNHQYPQQQQQQHHPSGQHHYQAITTPMQQEGGGAKASNGYGHHTRTHLTLLKRPAQRHHSKRPNTLRRHRSARLVLL